MRKFTALSEFLDQLPTWQYSRAKIDFDPVSKSRYQITISPRNKPVTVHDLKDLFDKLRGFRPITPQYYLRYKRRKEIVWQLRFTLSEVIGEQTVTTIREITFRNGIAPDKHIIHHETKVFTQHIQMVIVNQLIDGRRPTIDWLVPDGYALNWYHVEDPCDPNWEEKLANRYRWFCPIATVSD